jgi:hypothetical protein
MVKNEEDVAMDILEHVIWSALFSNKRSELALRMTIIGKSTSEATATDFQRVHSG